MSSYKVLRRDGSGVVLAKLKGFKMDFLLGSGESVLSQYPKKPATFEVDLRAVTRAGPERPGKAGKKPANVELRDVLVGLDLTFLTISERMKDVIQSNEPEVEFLPVTIKGYSEPYYIANVLQHVPCLDVKACDATLDSSGLAQRLKRLVLLDRAIPRDRALVQIKEFPDIFLVSASLAGAFEKAGFTGFELVEPKAFITT